MRQINPDQFIPDDDYSPELAPGTEDGLSHGTQPVTRKSFIDKLPISRHILLISETRRMLGRMTMPSTDFATGGWHTELLSAVYTV